MAEIIKHGGQIVGVVTNSDTTNSTSSITGSVILNGGIGIAQDVFIDGDLYYNGLKAPTVVKLRDIASTGLDSGGLISVNSSTSIDITAGAGSIIDNFTDPLNPIEIDVSWNAIINETITTLSNGFTHIYIDENGLVIQSLVQPTPTLRRTYIYLGKVFHTDGATVTSASSQPDVLLSIGAQAHDFWEGLGPVVLSGLRVKANGVNLSLDRTTGDLHQSGIGFSALTSSPNIKTLSAVTLASFGRSDRNGFISLSETVILPGFYDLAGVLTAIPGSTNRATNQRVYLFNSGFLAVQYGQEYYNSVADARENISLESFVVEPNTLANGILIGIISVRSGATDLSLNTDAVISNASKFGELGVGSAGVSSANFQNIYENSTIPQLLLDNTRNGLQIQDATISIAAPLFQIKDTTGTDIFSVDPSGKTTIEGNIEKTSGLLSITSTTGAVQIENMLVNVGAVSGITTLGINSDLTLGGNIVKSSGNLSISNTSGTVQVESVGFNAGVVTGVSTLATTSNITIGGNLTRTSGQLNITSGNAGVQVEDVLFTGSAITSTSASSLSSDATLTLNGNTNILMTSGGNIDVQSLINLQTNNIAMTAAGTQSISKTGSGDITITNSVGNVIIESVTVSGNNLTGVDNVNMVGNLTNSAANILLTAAGVQTITKSGSGNLNLTTSVGDIVLVASGGVVQITDPTTITNATDASSTTTGSLVVSGGVGIVKSLFVGGDVNVTGKATFADYGTVTQATSITTTVTLNAICGQITLDNSGSTLATDTRTAFLFNNNTITATSVVLYTYVGTLQLSVSLGAQSASNSVISLINVGPSTIAFNGVNKINFVVFNGV